VSRYVQLPSFIRHATSRTVTLQCEERLGEREVDPEVAVAIAASLQAPNGTGLVFARLVSHWPVELEELLAAVALERRDFAATRSLTPGLSVELDMFATWAIHNAFDVVDAEIVPE
jgi:hypothetical protein